VTSILEIFGLSLFSLWYLWSVKRLDHPISSGSAFLEVWKVRGSYGGVVSLQYAPFWPEILPQESRFDLFFCFYACVLVFSSVVADVPGL